MDPSLIAYSFSRLLITAALFYYKFTWAQDLCGHIDDDNVTELQVNTTDSIFYLHNPACTGNITSEPEDSLSDNELCNVKYAVYQRNGTNYTKKISSDLPFTFNVTHHGSNRETAGIREKRSENGYSEGILRCYNKHLEIQNGDIIGACIRADPDREDSEIVFIHRLDIVNRIKGQLAIADVPQTEPHQFQYINSCQRDTSLPVMIDLSQFSPVKLRSANISGKYA